MIHPMNKRVAGLIGVLALAIVATCRPAFAEEAAAENGWFDGASDTASAPAPAPAPAPGAPARPLVPYGAQAAPGPQPAAAPQVDEQDTDPGAITQFRSTLDPYGGWVDDPKYGTVWVPNRDAVGADFAPYVSAGHWALTDDGDWLWQSDYPFGGVVFHYGRWVWVPGTGWAWVAGRRYANAWVTWRVASDDYGYIGWAPMAPAWGWYGGVAIGLGWYPPSAYVFCPSRYAFSYGVHSYIVRDRAVIHDVAAHTRNYSDGRMDRVAASPRVLPANSAPPRGPSLQSARIPASSAPLTRVPVRSAFAGTRSSASPYGADGSRRTFSAGARPVVPYSSRSPAYANPGVAPRPYAAPSASTYRQPYRSAPSAPYRSAPSAPSYRAAPSFRSAPSAPSYRAAPSAPSYRAAPSFRSAPSAPSFHSSPSFHSPSRR